MNEVEEEMSTSSRWFKDAVWPEIQSWFGATGDVHLHTTEAQQSPVTTDFDIVSGIDYWVTDGKRGMTSIASRVQYDPHHKHTTFTIRYERPSGNDTEYQKRVRQRNSDEYVLPTYTVQAYVDTTLGCVYNAAAVKTEELYELIDAGTIGDDWPTKAVYDRGGEYDGQMLCVSWQEIDDTTELKLLDRQRAGLGAKYPDNPSTLEGWADYA